MSADVRPYRAAGAQTLACGHRIDGGTWLWELTLERSAFTLCRSCLDALGMLVLDRQPGQPAEVY